MMPMPATVVCIWLSGRQLGHSIEASISQLAEQMYHVPFNAMRNELSPCFTSVTPFMYYAVIPVVTQVGQAQGHLLQSDQKACSTEGLRRPITQ